MFEHKHLADALDQAFQYKNTDNNIITDITDGSEYKRVNIGRKQYDITLMLSTDGVLKKVLKKDRRLLYGQYVL